MSLFKKSPRRLAVRADAAEAESLTRSARPRIGPAVLISAVFVILATLVMYYPGQSVRYHIGEKAPYPLRSPVDFTVTDPQQTEQLRQAARANSFPVLIVEPLAYEGIQSQLINLQQDVRGAATPESLPAEVRARFPNLDAKALAWLHTVEPSAYLGMIRTLLGYLPNAPLVDAASAEAMATRQSDRVYVAQTPSLDTLVGSLPRDKIIPLHATDEAKQAYLRQWVTRAFPQDMADTISGFLLNLDHPIFRYDAKLTEQVAARNVAAVQAGELPIAQNQVIVEKNQIITPELYQRLEQAQTEYERRLARRHPWIFYISHLGQAVTVLLVTLIGAFYVTHMNARQNTVGRGWALAGLLLVTFFIAKGSVAVGFNSAVYLLGIAPTLLATVILVIAFNRRFALVIGVLHGLLVTLALGESPEFFLTLLTGVAVFAFGLREIRTLGKLIEMGVFASAALLASVWGLGVARFAGSVWDTAAPPLQDLDSALRTVGLNSLCAAAAGVGVGFVTLGILPFIQRIFKITTAMKLLELCDLNQPLLRRLASEAPGTFNHALIVGTMAEAAGNAIGANGLLCRVGAYYHDIGKLSKPQYFAENRSGGPNRHEKLSPAMSLLIIVGHVKDGIELAREYGLPWVVYQFIAQHHGTTLVEYFFHAAKEKQAREAEVRGDDSTQVSESEFRYPGPRPQTRETAILMICDGVESIARTLAEPTAGRLETIVHQLVMKRLMDGQFSECDLTLHDLSLIEESLARTLAGVYHGRVAYPKPLSFPQPA